MRLIDADELLYEKGAVEVTEFKEAIESCKTVDTERHGHWEFEKLECNDDYMFYCSECGYETSNDMNYCGYCGAKMDEETE